MHILFFLWAAIAVEAHMNICISTSYHMATRVLANISQEGVKCPRAIN